jgi:hypothetical protein
MKFKPVKLNEIAPHAGSIQLPWNPSLKPSAAHIIAAYDAASDKHKKEGMDWYTVAHEHAKLLGQGKPNGTHMAAGVLAAYSPRTDWTRNVHHATLAMTSNQAHGSDRGAMDMHKIPAQRIMNGEAHNEVLGGNKTKAFAHLIEHGGRDHRDPSKLDHHTVCVDTHAVNIAIGARTYDKDAKEYQKAIFSKGDLGNAQYEHVAEAYRQAAKHIAKRDGIDIAPHQVQAVTWIHHRHKHGLDDRTLCSPTGCGKCEHNKVTQNSMF